MIHDIKFAFRQLLKTPAFTFTAVIVLALGIGANTAIFSAVNALLLRPLPVRDIDRLVFSVALREGFDPFGSSFVEYAAYRDRSHAFESSGVATQRSFNITGRDQPERVPGAVAMAEYLTTLGVKPVLGRTFSTTDDKPSGAPVAVISYGLWQKHFGGSASAIGQTLTLDGRAHTIIGVMPPGFDLPAAAQIWLPLQTNIDSAPLTERATTNHEIVARLKPDVTVAQADAELKAIDRQLEQEYPEFRRGWSVKVVSLRQELLGDLEGHVRKSLFALMGGVGFLLLICCANIANLQLARGIAREREFAVRCALGAGRWQLLRQLLIENLVLALVGGVVGVLLANWLLPVLAAVNPIRGVSFAAFFYNFELDRRVLVFAFATAFLTGVIFGLLPGFKAACVQELIPRLKLGDQRGGLGTGRKWFNGIIVTEIAIALTLLVCGGLLLQSFQRLQHVDLGFKPDNVLAMKMVLPESKYSQYPARIAFDEQILERVRNLPGVVSAGTTTNVPLEREIAYDAVFNVEGRPPANPNEVPITSHRVVSPGYLETMGVTLIKGRLIDQNDRAGSLPVVVVSQEFARQAWPNEDAIDKRVRRVRAGQPFPWLTVVGVVKDVKEDLFNYRINRPVWYVPYAQVENNFPLNLAIRANGDPTSLIAAVRSVVRAVDPDQPISNVATMNTTLSGVLVTERFGAVLMGTLSILGLVLAALGLYGVMAYSVRQRTSEIGLRIALGAQPKHLFALIVGDGMKLTLWGAALGLASAWAATRLLVSLLFGLNAFDATTFGGITLVVGIAGLIACYLPARFAMKLDPVEALRCEG